jgi:hypothetical protein
MMAGDCGEKVEWPGALNSWIIKIIFIDEYEPTEE